VSYKLPLPLQFGCNRWFAGCENYFGATELVLSEPKEIPVVYTNVEIGFNRKELE
jgi:hypothetical protein